MVVADSMLSFRRITHEDGAFLYAVYASTRSDELSLTGWSESVKEDFLRMQFNAQHKYYLEHYDDSEFQIILLHDKPIGRLYLAHRANEIRIVDIALLPAYRNRGFGTHLLNQILSHATKEGLPVRIHVEKFNPAMRLYHRMGFHKIGDTGVYDLMQWTPTR